MPELPGLPLPPRRSAASSGRVKAAVRVRTSAPHVKVAERRRVVNEFIAVCGFVVG